MKVAKNEILYIYDADDLQQRQGLVYVQSMPNYQIREFNVRKDKLTPLQLAQVAELLKLRPAEMIDPSRQHPSEFADLDEHDFLDYLVANLFIIKTPIAIYEDRAEIVDSQFDFIKRDGRVSAVKEEAAIKSRPSKE